MKMKLSRTTARRGSIMFFIVVCIVSLMALSALGIDLGLLMLARNQCQNAADVAAMAGARALNGDISANYNSTAALAQSVTAAEQNQVLGQPIQASQVNSQLGSYTYNAASQSFQTSVPPANGSGPTLMQVTVSYTGNTYFAGVMGYKNFTVSATATAAHSPRDIVIVMDLTGSMKFGSLLGYSWAGNRTQSNNPEATYPTFGHYSSATLQNTTTNFDSNGNVFPPGNWTDSDSSNNNAIAIVPNDFFSSVSPTQVPAWTAAPTSYGASPAGDTAPHTNIDSGGAWAATPKAWNNNSTNLNAAWESGGYDQFKIGGKAFSGYTQGPNFWGKTFWMWPPDPRPAYQAPQGTPVKDWRQLYFIDAQSGGPLTLNGHMWDAVGNWLAPGSSTYKINYQAILQWIQQTPNPFPSSLVAGRIQYYTAIPDGTDSSLNARWWSTYPLPTTTQTQLNEAFWKGYIDYVLGLQQTGASSWTIITPMTGYGADFSWGGSTINTTFTPQSDATHRYMAYNDSPKRPLLRMWFGPMTMVDYMSNYNLNNQNPNQYNWMAGTAHETPLYPAKIAMQAALQDMKINHPNDFVSVVMFATPKQSANDAWGRFNAARSPLGQNYAFATETLWFPMSTVLNPGSVTNPFNTNDMVDTPHAEGGTCYAFGLMMAYNQLSSNTTLQTYDQSPPAPSGNAGGLGRIGAQKVVIFETDGEPNTTATATVVNGGAWKSYYNIRYNQSNQGSSEYPTGVAGYQNNDPTVTGQVYPIVQQIAAQSTASPPGYSTPSRPCKLYTIGFGPIFSPQNPGQATALQTLQTMQYYGNTSPSAATPLPGYQVVYGSPAAVEASLRTAIDQILNNGTQITLIN
jgi:Flp pilus assembly protein TadG